MMVLEDDFPLQLGDCFGSMLIFRGVRIPSSTKQSQGDAARLQTCERLILSWGYHVPPEILRWIPKNDGHWKM